MGISTSHEENESSFSSGEVIRSTFGPLSVRFCGSPRPVAGWGQRGCHSPFEDVAGALSALLWPRLRFRADGAATGVEDGVESERSEGEGGLDDFRVDEFHPSAGPRRAKWGATPPQMRNPCSKDSTSLG